jgi:hypothetical protein
MKKEQTEEETAKDKKMEDETEVEKCTAKTLYGKLETNIPINKTVRPRSQFPHSCICERFIYSQITDT